MRSIIVLGSICCIWKRYSDKAYGVGLVILLLRININGVADQARGEKGNIFLRA